MRPTPSETIAGIVRILRETVAPALDDAHARAQLQQIMTVLGQLRVEDPAADLAADNERLHRLLGQCADWATADGHRRGAFAIAIAIGEPPTATTFTAAHATNRAYRRELEVFLTELRAWRGTHGPEDSAALVEAIGRALAGDDHEEIGDP
jgi:hypothetical protein